MGTQSEEKDVFDKTRDVAQGIGNTLKGVIGGVRDRLEGPSTFEEGLEELITAFRTKGLRDIDIVRALRTKADRLSGD
jgi:hypothetical protein